jgi:hypothetical protein
MALKAFTASVAFIESSEGFTALPPPHPAASRTTREKNMPSLKKLLRAKGRPLSFMDNEKPDIV